MQAIDSEQQLTNATAYMHKEQLPGTHACTLFDDAEATTVFPRHILLTA
jgi:hypothetical protein